MRATALLAVLLLAAPALAADPPPPDPAVQAIVADWTAESRARDHSSQSLGRLIEVYQKAEAERAKLATEVAGWKDYAKPLYSDAR